VVDLPPELLLDTRLVDRHIKRGLLTREAYEQALAALPDASANAMQVRPILERIGIRNRRAEATGEGD
jgi:hypothetical protein